MKTTQNKTTYAVCDPLRYPMARPMLQLGRACFIPKEVVLFNCIMMPHIATELFAERRIKATDVVLLGYIMSCDVRVTNKELAAFMGCSLRSVQTMLSRLRDVGVLQQDEIERVRHFRVNV